MSRRGHCTRCDCCFSAVVNRSWKQSQYERCGSLDLGCFVKEGVVLGKNDMGKPNCRTYVIGHAPGEQVDSIGHLLPCRPISGAQELCPMWVLRTVGSIALVLELSFRRWV